MSKMVVRLEHGYYYYYYYCVDLLIGRAMKGLLL